MTGIPEYTAILNPPHAAILVVGTTVTKPIVINGPLVIGQTVTVPLSCDHRLFDGAIGALKQLIDASALLLVRGARWQSSRDFLP